MTNANFSFAFQFATREVYVIQRAAWKANYKALTLAQREAKIELKKAFRADEYSAANRFISEVASNKVVARGLLDTLASAKKEAQAQYLAQKAEKMATA